MSRTIARSRRTLTAPMSWSRQARRIFVVLLPVTGLLWVIAYLALSLVLVAVQVSRPVGKFWSAPARPLAKDYDLYSYGRSSSRRASRSRSVSGKTSGQADSRPALTH